ncbi:Lrp/AsnC family transcriptional regulator, partial [Candidatus Bathyarchaeota archaeon]
MSQLDEMNVKIINAMKKNGPRNLQKIAQIAGLKYPTTYSRISKLEDGGLLATWAQPNFSKLGLSRAIVYVTPMAGMDALAREALKVPGYWLRVTRCMGESNGYFSIHAVPTANRQDFQQYLDHLT